MSHLRPAAGVALGGALLTLSALAFAIAPLLVPGIAFLALGGLIPAAVWLLAQGADVLREPGESEVREGVPYRSSVRVGVGPFGLLGGSLHDPIVDEPLPVRAAPSWRRRELRFTLQATFERRGLHVLAPPALRLIDPLGLAGVERRGGESQRLLVLPATATVHWRARDGATRALSLEHTPAPDDFAASDIDGLRPYRPGTPASRIDWTALARGAGLLERRLRGEHQSRPLVLLDSRCGEEAADALDAAVRAAASLVLELARRRGCGLMTAGDGRALEIDTALTGWPAAHRRLALVSPGSTPPILGARRSAGALFYVAAVAPPRLPAPLREAGGVLVLPAGAPAPGRLPVSFEVAGCLGYALGPRPRSAAEPEPAAPLVRP